MNTVWHLNRIWLLFSWLNQKQWQSYVSFAYLIFTNWQFISIGDMHKLNYIVSRVVHKVLYLQDKHPHNTHGEPTGASAYVRSRSWVSMASFQASSTIEYLSLDNIGEVVFVSKIALMNLFAISQVAFWCWGTFCSPPALGCRTCRSPLDIGSGSTWEDRKR